MVLVGSGLAGLSTALHLAPTHRVAVITKRSLHDGASHWAQGGIAAAKSRSPGLPSPPCQPVA
jgi:L-aspartate oxidase